MRTKTPAKPMKTSRTPSTLSSNGDRKKLKRNRSNGHQETMAADGPNESFNSRELLRVLTEVKNGNFTVRMPLDEVGVSGKIFDTLNEIISFNERMMLEFTRAGNTIGKRGQLTQRI